MAHAPVMLVDYTVDSTCAVARRFIEICKSFIRSYRTKRDFSVVCACDYGRPFVEFNQTASCWMPYRA